MLKGLMEASCGISYFCRVETDLAAACNEERDSDLPSGCHSLCMPGSIHCPLLSTAEHLYGSDQSAREDISAEVRLPF